MGSKIMLVGTSVCDIVLITPRLSEPGDVIYLNKGVAISIGGHPCNIGIDLVKLGYNPKNIFVVSAIGNDYCGIFIEKTISEYSIQTKFFKLHDLGSTKNVIVVINGEDRRFHVDVGASYYLSLNHVLNEFSEIKPNLLFIAPGLLGEVDENLHGILKNALKLNSITFVDVGAAKPFSKSSWDFLIRALEYVDIFHCNTYELRKVMGEADIVRGVKRILDKGVKLMLITDGDKGAYIAKDGYLIHQKAFRVKVVDPTGAGDAFQAGLIYRLATIFGENLSRESLDEIVDVEMLSDLLLYAQAVGAVCVTAPGTTTAISRENIEKLLAEQRDYVLRSTICMRLQ